MPSLKIQADHRVFLFFVPKKARACLWLGKRLDSVNDTLGIPNKISTLCGFGDGALLISFLVFFCFIAGSITSVANQFLIGQLCTYTCLAYSEKNGGKTIFISGFPY